MCKEELLTTIERKRNELIQTGIDHGLNSPIALKLSQELDELLNSLEKIVKLDKEVTEEKNT